MVGPSTNAFPMNVKHRTPRKLAVSHVGPGHTSCRFLRRFAPSHSPQQTIINFPWRPRSRLITPSKAPHVPPKLRYHFLMPLHSASCRPTASCHAMPGRRHGAGYPLVARLGPPADHYLAARHRRVNTELTQSPPPPPPRSTRHKNDRRGGGREANGHCPSGVNRAGQPGWSGRLAAE